MALKERDAAEATMSQVRSSISDNVLDTYFRMESEYLESMTAPPLEDLVAIEYLNILERLESKEKEYATCRNAPFVTVEGTSTTDLHHSTLCVARHASCWRTTLDQLMTIQDEVECFEDQHGISPRWTRFNKEWINADQIRKNQHFRQCVDELERLVVQRLFELSRAGLANTALIARSKAIKAAMTHYNKAANQFDPPALTVTWEMIASSCEKILDQDWAKPNHRCLVDVRHHLQQAEEEIEQLNVEVHQVLTMIHDERRDLPLLAAHISRSDKGLGWAANYYVSQRLKVNVSVEQPLKKLVSQRAFTGTRDIGVHIEDDIESPPLQGDFPVPCDSDNLEPEEPNETLDMAGELDVGEVDEEAISEQLGQWHLALARMDSDAL
ncbi:hypothetical protein FRC11_009800 [Ceratobasidium sp. 423]|nr:hypothetical protein FRC11_009800 [Ceratobasidium sp. 423]